MGGFGAAAFAALRSDPEIPIVLLETNGCLQWGGMYLPSNAVPQHRLPLQRYVGHLGLT